MWDHRVGQSPPRRICQLRLAGQLQPCLPCSTIRHLAGSASCCLAASPLCPGCPSLPLLPVWMNVSSLSPLLLDFHTVCFPVSSGCFLFLNLLLSFLWLCKETQCVYLCLHLDQKPQNIILKSTNICLIYYFILVIVVYVFTHFHAS